MQDFSAILALNVRTEIAFGMSSESCTALSWKSKETSILAQNWDWQEEQEDNLIHLRLERNDEPDIEMITEAGIIGKIDLNSAGVGVCLSAIRAKGTEFGKIPCHLPWRKCPDSSSREEAIVGFKNFRVASSCHILVADREGDSGLECSSAKIVEIPMSPEGLVVHTNHFIKEHPWVEENIKLEDSQARLTWISKLAETAEADVESFRAMLEDEDGVL
ncbi:MAG: hypothetical protein Q9208_002297 [Pyrenodesmia sp. 3 TL-2023]